MTRSTETFRELFGLWVGCDSLLFLINTFAVFFTEERSTILVPSLEDGRASGEFWRSCFRKHSGCVRKLALSEVLREQRGISGSLNDSLWVFFFFPVCVCETQKENKKE